MKVCLHSILLRRFHFNLTDFFGSAHFPLIWRDRKKSWKFVYVLATPISLQFDENFSTKNCKNSRGFEILAFFRKFSDYFLRIHSGNDGLVQHSVSVQKLSSQPCSIEPAVDARQISSNLVDRGVRTFELCKVKAETFVNWLCKFLLCIIMH